VQAGVFEDPDNAQALADSLQAQGFSPAITTARTGGKVLYRVQVGVFSSREGAKEMADQLSSKGFQAYIAED
jgi:cell division protein FtsN